LQAKPGKYLWIGGISSSVTEEQLEDELLQFGKLEEYRFLRDRNSALVGYYKFDDAIAAQKNLNGKSIGGEQVRVDFQKPQSSRRVCMVYCYFGYHYKCFFCSFVISSDCNFGLTLIILVCMFTCHSYFDYSMVFLDTYSNYMGTGLA